MTHNNLANPRRKTSRCIWLNKRRIILFNVALLGILGCSFANTGAEDTTSFGTSDKLWSAIFKATAASLLATLIVFALAVLWISLRDSPIKKWIYKHKWIVYAFFVLILLTPVVLLLLKGASSPLIALAVYARELLVSVAFVVSASVALKVLARINQESEAREDEQLNSWRKWLQGDETGWHELWEVVCFTNRLSPAVQSAVKRELSRVQQGEPETRSNGHKERLRLLLLSPSQVGKLSSDELLEKAIDSPGFIHSEDFLGHIVEKIRGEHVN